MSLMSTVNPPFTLPVMMPVTVSAFSNARSRSPQAWARFAFSRDNTVVP